MDTEVLSALVQFGAAGLMGWMWLTERRSAAAREKQIDEAHVALMNERQKLDVLVSALEGNTRAITALEVGQRRLAELVERAPASFLRTTQASKSDLKGREARAPRTKRPERPIK